MQFSSVYLEFCYFFSFSGKFLAFIGPVDCSVSLYHPPEMYIGYFLENNVKIVVRLNKRLYDQNV